MQWRGDVHVGPSLRSDFGSGKSLADRSFLVDYETNLLSTNILFLESKLAALITLTLCSRPSCTSAFREYGDDVAWRAQTAETLVS